MEWIEPVEIKPILKYSSSLVRSDDDDSTILSGQIPDHNLAWFATEDQLNLHSSIHNGVKNRNFQCLQGQEFQVTCLAPIPGELLALVGLSSSTGSGAVALFNYSTSMILQSWSVSHKVTSICSIEIPSYKQFLNTDCFLFALGTEEGHVMLLAVDQHFKLSEGTHHLDLNIVHYATTDDIIHKRAYMKPPLILVIPLNDPMYRAGRFILESMQESQSMLSVPQEDVYVTALRYIPQNQSLSVGYNLQGAFQMFSLKSLDLDFSGFAQGFKGEHLGKVLDFVFLEPEDDPRHYCYLMVITEKECEKQPTPYASLYSLTYVHNDTSPEALILYEDLQHITLRLEIDFGPLIMAERLDESGQDIRFLTCRSFTLGGSANTSNSSKPTGCHGSCYFGFLWVDSIYLAVFDLNQWYQAQMPSRWIFDDLSTLCPFMGFYRCPLSTKSTPQVWVQPESWSIFHRSSVVNPSEAYYYPSALNFRVTVVSHAQCESMFFLGIQSLLLYKIAQAGSQVLTQPHRFYVLASKAGLIPPEMDIAAPSVTQMAEALLNVGLENNARAFLVSCIKDEGANLNFVEKWAWQQVLNLKSLRENLCEILFDHSTQELEEKIHHQLYRVTHQFNNLSVLYDVMDDKIRALNSGVNDKLRDKSRAVYLLSLHLQTVLWFLHGGLLPEVDESVAECSSLPYPHQELQKFYHSRKSEIEALSSSVRSHEVLLIEQLVPNSIRDLWIQESGPTDLTYPPPSLYALLSSYLRPDVDDVTKHRIVQYVFLDLTWIYGRHAHYGNILQHLMTFPSTYSLSPSLIKITQAFWHLDHQNFDDALSMLLDPLVSTMDITNSQQRAILRSFLYQDQRMHALKYATLRQPICPELEDIQLHLTILIANSLVGDALTYLRQNRNRQNDHQLMQHLLCGCREMKKLNVLFTLPLSETEEEQLTSFLKQSKNIDLQEALLLYYIQRCKYPDAIAYSERLNKMWPARDAASRERFNNRNMLMQTLINALPPITCKLAAIANSRPTEASPSRGKFPQPLSVTVLPATSSVQYSGSAFFRTVMEQSRATWLIEQKLHQETQTPLKVRKRKMDESVEETEGLGPESTPFLSNIVQQSKRNVVLGMSLTFVSPKVNNTTTMMDITSMEPPPEISETRQTKRPRYSLFPKPLGVKTDAEVSNVLQTPPINRSRKLTTESVENVSRPSSILKDKMRRFINFSFPAEQPGEYIVYSETQHSASDQSETEMEVTEMGEATEAPKQLRFALPKMSPTTDLEAPRQSTPDKDETSDVAEAETSKAQLEEFLSFEEEPTPEVSNRTGEVIPPPSASKIKLQAEVHERFEQESEPPEIAVEESEELTVLKPVEVEAPTKTSIVDEVHVAPQDAEDDSDGDIVCLDSTSEEDVEVGEDQEEEEQEQEEQEIDEEEESYEIEEQEMEELDEDSNQTEILAESCEAQFSQDLLVGMPSATAVENFERPSEKNEELAGSAAVEGSYDDEPIEMGEEQQEENQQLIHHETPYQAASITRSRFALSSSDESSSLDGQSIPEEEDDGNRSEVEIPGANDGEIQCQSENKADVNVSGNDGDEEDEKEDEEGQAEEETDVGHFHLQMAEVTPTIVDRPHRRRMTEVHKFSLSLSMDEEYSDEEEEGKGDEDFEVQGEQEESKERDQADKEFESPGEDRATPPVESSHFAKTRLHLSDLDVTEEDSEVAREYADYTAVKSQMDEDQAVLVGKHDASLKEDLGGSSTEELEDENVIARSLEPRDDQERDEKRFDLDDGSSTDENEDLKELLVRHEVVGIPIPETVVSLVRSELSTIVEENADQSCMTMSMEPAELPRSYESLNVMYVDTRSRSQSPILATAQNPEVQDETEKPEDSIEAGNEPEENEPTAVKENVVNEEVGDEDVFETKESESKRSGTEPAAEQVEFEQIALKSSEVGDATNKEVSVAEEPRAEKDSETEDSPEGHSERRTRSRSLRLSRVALPFSSRRSIYDSKREVSPERGSSEPPSAAADLMNVTGKPRRRRHSISNTSAPVQSIQPTRRSRRLSATATSEVEEADVKETKQPSPPRTPSRASRTRRTSKSSVLEDDEVPPSVEVSPTGSSISGSFCGTPVRRSARIAQREQTPEPSLNIDPIVIGSGRRRRHSASAFDAGVIGSPVAARRSGRKSSLSRDVSPESVASEPPMPSNAELTPSRRRSSRITKAGQKSCTLNLFPVLEETESVDPARAPSRTQSEASSVLTYKTEPMDEEQATPPKEDPSTLGAEETSNIVKRSTRTRAPSSTSSSPGPGRYNLRRTRRNSELELITESESGPSDTMKRIRDEQTTEESTESDQQTESVAKVPTKRSTRNKRKKEEKNEEEEEAEEVPESEETLTFVRRPRQPRNLPKRDPQIKSRPGPRRSMKLE